MLLINKMRRKIRMQVKLKMSQSWMELKRMELNQVEMDSLHVVEREIKEAMERRIVMKNKKRVMKRVERKMRLIKRKMMIQKSHSPFQKNVKVMSKKKKIKISRINRNRKWEYQLIQNRKMMVDVIFSDLVFYIFN